MDYQAFVDSKKSLLIAPAGHGKTHAIAECLQRTEGRQLVLTHTHAGISSLKSKFKKTDVDSSGYHVETISGFLQRYVLAFYTGGDLPLQGESRFHNTIIEKALPIFQTKLTQAILKASYRGIFIDEYQDCSTTQHKVLMEMAKILPCHLLGDPLQGIFGFNGEIVEFDRDLVDFERFPLLPTPHRWQSNGNNKELGQLMVKIRGCLEAQTSFTLLNDPAHGRHLIDTTGQTLTEPKSSFGQELQKVIHSQGVYQAFQSILIIVPEYSRDESAPAGNVSDRASLLKRIDFDGSIKLLEAIDDRKFYSDAKKLDDFFNSIERARKPIKKTYETLNLIFQKTSPSNLSNVGLDDWFSKRTATDWQAKAKQGELGLRSKEFKTKIEHFARSPSHATLLKIIQFLDGTIKCKYHKRPQLAKDLIKCLEQAVFNGCTVIEAMVTHKNIVRRNGRKVDGKCLGTTLLTKGLEFDTVVILDAHRFNCPKHFYVAVTRCCKQLIIFADGNKFSPYV